VKVSFFITCMCDIVTPEVGKHSVELLERLGCEVDFPKAQTCCGQPAFNSGYLENSKESMKQMIKAFKDSEYVVGPSGSCVGMVREYANIFKDDPEWGPLAMELRDKTYELTQFIVDVLQIVDLNASFPGKVTYHPSCHMTRILGVKAAPLKLLKKVQNLELIELPIGEDCCGFGGTFAVKNSVISGEMVKEKSRHVTETNAEYLVGGDMACLLNIGGRMQREGKHVEIKHIAEILNS